EVPAAELTLRRLLTLAHEGLCQRGVDTREAERLLEVIEQRCLTGRTGASWQTETVHALEERSGLDRDTALREMTQRYLKLMTTGGPGRPWPVAWRAAPAAGRAQTAYRRSPIAYSQPAARPTNPAILRRKSSGSKSPPRPSR